MLGRYLATSVGGTITNYASLPLGLETRVSTAFLVGVTLYPPGCAPKKSLSYIGVTARIDRTSIANY